MAMNDRHILGLDLIRFAAAAMVMAFHYDHAFPQNRLSFAWAGWVGVEVFFVISGFVIAYSAEGATASSFVKARVARLMPAAWISGTATATIVAFSGNTGGLFNQYIRTVSLWLTGPYVDAVYWTLPIEITFYVFVFCTLGRQSLLSLRNLIRILAIGSGLWWLGRLVVAADAASPIDAARFEMVPPILLSLVQFGCYFALGALFRETMRYGMTASRSPLMLVCLASGIAQIMFNAFAASSGAGAARPFQAQELVPVIVWITLVVTAGSSVILNRRIWAALARLSGAIRALGLATYPLYLLHARFGVRLGVIIHLDAFATAALMVVLSVLVATVFEPPIRRGLKFVSDSVPLRARVPQPATQEPV